LLDYLDTIGNSLKYLYLLALLAGVLRYRTLNSYVVTAIVLLGSELVMNPLRDPVFDFANQMSSSNSIRFFTLFWSLLDFLFIVALYFFHSSLSITSSSPAKFVMVSFGVLILLHSILFIDFTYFQPSSYIDIYSFAIPSVNVMMGLFMLYYFITEVANDRRHHSNRSF